MNINVHQLETAYFYCLSRSVFPETPADVVMEFQYSLRLVNVQVQGCGKNHSTSSELVLWKKCQNTCARVVLTSHDYHDHHQCHVNVPGLPADLRKVAELHRYSADQSEIANQLLAWTLCESFTNQRPSGL